MLLCKSPIRVKSLNRSVDCGHCRACRLRSRSTWAMRLQHEASTYNHNACFVTLTYNKEHLPADYQLKIEHLQKFWKRLRITLTRMGHNVKIKYYACGEYGSKTHRPHYHAIIFGVGVRHADVIFTAWGMCDSVGFRCESINSPAAYGYVAGYCTKKLGKGYSRSLRLLGRVPEYQTSSNGLGAAYAMVNIPLSGAYTGYIRHGGKWRIPPRYYRKILRLDSSLYADEIESYNQLIMRSYTTEGQFSAVQLWNARKLIDMQLQKDFGKWRNKVE